MWIIEFKDNNIYLCRNKMLFQWKEIELFTDCACKIRQNRWNATVEQIIKYGKDKKVWSLIIHECVLFYLKHSLPLFAKSGTNWFLFALWLHSSLRMTSIEMCLVNADFVILSWSTPETGSMSTNTYTLEYGLAVCITFEENKTTLIKYVFIKNASLLYTKTQNQYKK